MISPFVMILSATLALQEGAVLQEAAEPIPVGMPAQMEQLVLPGSLLEVRPLTDRDVPMVVRIVEAWPHGDSYRYDIEYYGLEPGSYDLKGYLQRQDGSATDDLPAIVVEITSSLPPGQILPNTVSPGQTPSLGGYKTLLIIAGVIWVAGLAAILLVGRKQASHLVASESHRVTFDERLRAAIESAASGAMDEADRAELERMVMAYWRRRLGLEEMEAAEAIALMRRDDEARLALEQLERWLHDPSGELPDDFQRLVDSACDSHSTEQA